MTQILKTESPPPCLENHRGSEPQDSSHLREPQTLVFIALGSVLHLGSAKCWNGAGPDLWKQWSRCVFCDREITTLCGKCSHHVNTHDCLRKRSQMLRLPFSLKCKMLHTHVHVCALVHARTQTHTWCRIWLQLMNKPNPGFPLNNHLTEDVFKASTLTWSPVTVTGCFVSSALSGVSFPEHLLYTLVPRSSCGNQVWTNLFSLLLSDYTAEDWEQPLRQRLSG